ncbi:hypothetical protein H9638_04490 [Arthrobacter sp. Sa2BUA2]|uniref:Uncharacterized protein n=1 Tax=Arthrobacter pullicola TaxID=2762224 RepID=A0ABR8YFQ5_9MICC|nr:hypothetical protein [Arthrobacter pullicola]MBD8043066.1 hypothetical protein [Arthrobacter pullicola]
MHSSSRTVVPLGARAGLAALACGLLAAASLASAPAASAADDFLQISLDGRTFGTSAAGSVFADGARLVPGATSTASVWVRNTGPEPAFLTAAALSTAMDPELAGHLAVRSSAADAPATGQAVIGPAGSCTDLDLDLAIPAGGTRQVELAAGLQLDTPNAARSKQGSFDLLLLLDSAGTGRSACDAAAEPVRPIQVPSPAAGQPQLPAGAAALPGSSTVLVAAVPAAGPAALQPAETVPVPGAVPSGSTDAPPEITAAAFIESTVEPIIRTWQGTLMVLLTAAFFAAAAVRTRITRRTP